MAVEVCQSPVKVTGNAFTNQEGNFFSISTEEIFVHGVLMRSLRCLGVDAVDRLLNWFPVDSGEYMNDPLDPLEPRPRCLTLVDTFE